MYNECFAYFPDGIDCSIPKLALSYKVLLAVV
jgi:hypothetical protein